MTLVLGDLRDDLRTDFHRACVELAEARLRQRRKDDRPARTDVVECRHRIDTVLDLYLEMRSAA
jgi:hypothetical protein